MTDGLSTLYQDLLDGSYDCVDRIVLNAYFRMGHHPGGFRVWWRALTGSDETLENFHLMRLAGRFSRRIRGYAKAHGIPVIDWGLDLPQQKISLQKNSDARCKKNREDACALPSEAAAILEAGTPQSLVALCGESALAWCSAGSAQGPQIARISLGTSLSH
jgi:hypothetical protein